VKASTETGSFRAASIPDETVPVEVSRQPTGLFPLDEDDVAAGQSSALPLLRNKVQPAVKQAA